MSSNGKKTTEKRAVREKKRPENWPEGVWFSEADNALYKTAVTIAGLQPELRAYGGNKELEEQVSLRLKHQELISKLTATKKREPKKETLTPGSSIVYSIINAGKGFTIFLFYSSFISNHFFFQLRFSHTRDSSMTMSTWTTKVRQT